MRLVLYALALLGGVAVAVVSLVLDLPVATLIFGVLIAVVGAVGLILHRRVKAPVPQTPPGTALDRGAALEADGDLDGALAAYQEAADADDPRVAPVGHLRISTVLARRAELPAAEEHARKALAYPAGRHTVAATILLASVAMRAGKTEVAKTAVTELSASDDPQQAAAGRAYQAMFAIAEGDVSDVNVATLKAASNSGDQLTGTFLEMIQQAKDATSASRREPEAGEG
jgi:tetratricopeptide (TPR) repeat protein